MRQGDVELLVFCAVPMFGKAPQRYVQELTSRSSKDGGWTTSTAREFVEARSRSGGTWALRGELIALGTGRVLANLEGIEEIRVSMPWSAKKEQAMVLSGGAGTRISHAAAVLSRTSLFYTDPHGNRLKKFRFRPTTPAREVTPVLTPVKEMQIALDTSGALVLDKSGARVVLPPPERARGFLAASWAYVGRRIGKGSAPRRPAVVETYNYALDNQGGLLTWTRVGTCPPWYGSGQCLTHLHGTRVKGGWAKIDTRLKAWLRDVGRPNPLSSTDFSRQSDTETSADDCTGKSLPERTKTQRARLLGIF